MKRRANALKSEIKKASPKPVTPLKPIDSRHWTGGGTGLTNFSPIELARYREGVARYNKITGNYDYVISFQPLSPSRRTSQPQYSLHHLSCGDSSLFWSIFNNE